MKRILSVLILFMVINPVFSFSISHKNKKKKQEPMVHTVEEWLDSAQSVKIEMRKIDETKEEDKKYLPPKEIPAYFESYNINSGSKELDLTYLHKTKIVRSPFIIDSNYKNILYTETNFYPQAKQTASTIYLIEPDNYLSNQEKIEKLNIFEHTRYPLISTALPYLKDGFFSTLTVVDFSKSGDKFIAKEKRGSNKYGIYETYVWIYFFTDEPKEANECYLNNVDFTNDFNETFVKNSDFSELQSYDDIDYENLSEVPKNTLNDNNEEINQKNIMKDSITLTYDDLNSYIKSVWKDKKTNNIPKTRWYNKLDDFREDIPQGDEKKYKGYGVRLNLLNETIKAYWFDRKELNLNYIRWDLKPLGFNSSNNDEIIIEAWGYNLNGGKISLGNWAVNINNGLVRLMGENEPITVEANALFLQKRLNRD